jgi:methionyl-tRNA formyltransferase
MVDKPDAGRIVDQMAVPILPDDVAVDVFRKVTVAAELVLHRSLPRLAAGTATLTPQDLSQGSYFGARRPEDGRIDWGKSALEVHNLVRAVAPPYPGAFTTFRGSVLRVLRTRLTQETAPPGIAIDEHGMLHAGCGDGRRLDILQAEP